MSREKRTQVGQIWLAIEDFWTSGESRSSGSNSRYQKILIESGEKLEVRYPYEWHLRTEDNNYFHISEETLRGSCILFGKIHEDVRFSSSKELSEILRDKDYKLSSLIEGS